MAMMAGVVFCEYLCVFKCPVASVHHSLNRVCVATALAATRAPLLDISHLRTRAASASAPSSASSPCGDVSACPTGLTAAAPSMTAAEAGFTGPVSEGPLQSTMRMPWSGLRESVGSQAVVGALLAKSTATLPLCALHWPVTGTEHAWAGDRRTAGAPHPHPSCSLQTRPARTKVRPGRGRTGAAREQRCVSEATGACRGGGGGVVGQPCVVLRLRAQSHSHTGSADVPAQSRGTVGGPTLGTRAETACTHREALARDGADGRLDACHEGVPVAILGHGARVGTVKHVRNLHATFNLVSLYVARLSSPLALVLVLRGCGAGASPQIAARAASESPARSTAGMTRAAPRGQKPAVLGVALECALMLHTEAHTRHGGAVPGQSLAAALRHHTHVQRWRARARRGGEGHWAPVMASRSPPSIWPRSQRPSSSKVGTWR